MRSEVDRGMSVGGHAGEILQIMPRHRAPLLVEPVQDSIPGEDAVEERSERVFVDEIDFDLSGGTESSLHSVEEP